MGEISDAIERNEERKSATFGQEFDESPLGIQSAGKRNLQLLINGLDLDADEVVDEAMMAAGAATAVLMSGTSDVTAVLKGLWVDGLITGMLIANKRKD